MTPLEYGRLADTFLTPEANTHDYFWPALASEVLELTLAEDKENTVKEIGDVLFFLSVLGHTSFLGAYWGTRYRVVRPVCQTELVKVANTIIGNLAKMVREPHTAPYRYFSMIEAANSLVPMLHYLAHEAGVTLEYCAERNIAKLTARKLAGTICGDGDNR